MPSTPPGQNASTPSTAMRSTMGAAALLMGASVLLSRIIGLIREQFVAWKFGVSGATDVYFAAFTFPDFLNYLLAGGALSITFVPIFSKYIADKREEEGARVFSIVVSFLAIVLTLGILLGEFLTPWGVSRFFEEIPQENLPQLIRLTRIVFPAQFFHVLGAVIMATLLARGRFAAAALAPILYNLGIILGGVFLGDWLGVEGLAWGVLIGAFFGPFLIPLVQAIRSGLRFSPSLSLSHPGFRRFFRTALPVMLGVSLVTVDQWISQRIAVGEQGVITQLNYGRKLMLLPMGLLAQAAGAASYPFFARLFAEGKQKELANTVIRTTRTVVVLSILLTALAIPLAVPAISVLFERGEFLSEDVANTAPLFICYILGLLSWGIQNIWSRACYATGDTLRPMILSSILVLLIYPVFYLAYAKLGAPGLALASSLGISLQAFFLAPILKKHLPSLRFTPLWSGIWRAVLIAIPGGFLVFAINTWLLPNWSNSGIFGILRLAIGGVIFLLFVFGFAKLVSLKEIEVVQKKIKTRFYRTPTTS